MLYQRTLHPELFKLHASEQVNRRMYEADVWIVDGGHVITFGAGKNTLTEVIVNAAPGPDRPWPDSNDPVPRRALSRDDAGQHQVHDLDAGRANSRRRLYDASRAEIRQYAMKRELMVADIHLSADGLSGGFLSVLDIERPQPRAARSVVPPVRRLADGDENPGHF